MYVYTDITGPGVSMGAVFEKTIVVRVRCTIKKQNCCPRGCGAKISKNKLCLSVWTSSNHPCSHVGLLPSDNHEVVSKY